MVKLVTVNTLFDDMCTSTTATVILLCLVAIKDKQLTLEEYCQDGFNQTTQNLGIWYGKYPHIVKIMLTSQSMGHKGPEVQLMHLEKCHLEKSLRYHSSDSMTCHSGGSVNLINTIFKHQI